MRHISVSEFSTLRWSFFQDVVKYSSLGFESIGLWRHKFNGVDPSEVADYLQEMKMSVSSVSWAGGFTGSDCLSFGEAINDAIDAIELAGTVGSQCLVIHPGARNGHTRRHSQRLLTAAIEELIPIANDFDVRLAIEPMLPKTHRQWTIFNSVTDAIKLITKYPPAQLGMVLDLFHVGLDKQVFDQLENLKPWLALVQIADSRCESGYPVRTLLGEGEVPIADWLFAIDNMGYGGPMELEIHSLKTGPLDYVDLLDRSREFVVSRLARPHRVEAQSRSTTSN